MIVVDVNVLVAAHLATHPHHEAALPFLTDALATDSVLIPDMVWSGFLRIATNPRIFEVPASLDEAISFVRAVVVAPGYRHIAGLPDGLEPFLALTLASGSTGALIPDAYIASVARAHGCAVATFDRDFRRFDDLALVELW